MPDVAALYIFGSEEYVGGVRTGRAGQGTHAWRCAGYWALFGMWGHLFSFLRDVDPFFCFFLLQFHDAGVGSAGYVMDCALLLLKAF